MYVYNWYVYINILYNGCYHSGIMSLLHASPVSEKLVRHLPGGRGLVGSLCSWWRSQESPHDAFDAHLEAWLSLTQLDWAVRTWSTCHVDKWCWWGWFCLLFIGSSWFFIFFEVRVVTLFPWEPQGWCIPVDWPCCHCVVVRKAFRAIRMVRTFRLFKGSMMVLGVAGVGPLSNMKQ